MQATGRDARGGKQYRYPARWRQVRDGNKYARLSSFGKALGPLRERVSSDMSLPGFPRDICAQQRIVRPHHVAQAAREGGTERLAAAIPREEWRAAR